MILLIDNYDSFTFNLVHVLGDLGARCDVVRNDAITPAEALARAPEAIVLSPGPCTPNEAGICLDLIHAAAGKIPLLGVCLGHQAIGQAFGGQVVRAAVPMHGKVSAVTHHDTDLFHGLPTPFQAARYHSLVVAPRDPPRHPGPDRLDRGRRHHGPPPPRTAHLRRPVPPREHRLGARPPPAPELPRSGAWTEQPGRRVNNLKPTLARLATGATLSEAESEAAFGIVMSGEATPAQIAGLLMAMRVRRETVPELTGAVRAMLARMTEVGVPSGAIDVCGTGGDGAGTLNVSTAVSFVVAGAGVPVAKHGNRALSSKSGAADVLTALGVNVDASLDRLPAILAAAGCIFMFAPRHHAALRHAAGPRVELGTRTIFNLLGPLANPARVRRQLTGVFDPAWTRPMAETLAALGTERAWLVHGQGLDELSVAGDNHVVSLDRGAITEHTLTPEDAGLPRAPVEAIHGGDAAANATALLALLHGEPGPYRDTVLFNAAAALIVAGRADTLRDGVAQAARSIDQGAALAALDALRQATLPPLPPAGEGRGEGPSPKHGP